MRLLHVISSTNPAGGARSRAFCSWGPRWRNWAWTLRSPLATPRMRLGWHPALCPFMRSGPATWPIARPPGFYLGCAPMPHGVPSERWIRPFRVHSWHVESVVQTALSLEASEEVGVLALGGVTRAARCPGGDIHG